jgi:hypothetical protein
MKQHNTYRSSTDNNKIYLMLACFVFAASIATAQSSSLPGFVKDEATLSPAGTGKLLNCIPQKILPELTGTVTNSNGVFALNRIEQGDYYVLIKSVSYQPKIINELNLKNNNIDIGIITLKAAVIQSKGCYNICKAS